MTIPHNRLSPEALRRLIEQFVSRDGIDPGHAGTTLERKVRDVQRQLEKGTALLVYDPQSQTCNIVSQDELKRLDLETG